MKETLCIVFAILSTIGCCIALSSLPILLGNINTTGRKKEKGEKAMYFLLNLGVSTIGLGIIGLIISYFVFN